MSDPAIAAVFVRWRAAVAKQTEPKFKQEAAAQLAQFERDLAGVTDPDPKKLAELGATLTGVVETLEKIAVTQAEIDRLQGNSSGSPAALVSISVAIERWRIAIAKVQSPKVKADETAALGRMEAVVAKVRAAPASYDMAKVQEIANGVNDQVKLLESLVANEKEIDRLLGAAIAELNRNADQRRRAEIDQLIAAGRATAKDHYDRAMIMARANDMPAAIADLTKAVTLNPKYGEAFYLRGTIYQSQNKHSEAGTDFNSAVIAVPTEPKYFFERAATLVHFARYAEAERDLNDAVRLDPKYAEAFGQRAIARALLGRYDEAIADVDLATSLKPTNTALTALRTNILKLKADAPKP